jgi:hypothetical protein
VSSWGDGRGDLSLPSSACCLLIAISALSGRRGGTGWLAANDQSAAELLLILLDPVSCWTCVILMWSGISLNLISGGPGQIWVRFWLGCERAAPGCWLAAGVG